MADSSFSMLRFPNGVGVEGDDRGLATPLCSLPRTRRGRGGGAGAHALTAAAATAPSSPLVVTD